MFSRRYVLGGLLFGGLTACGSDPTSTVSLFRKTVSSKPRPDNAYPLDARQIDDLPYATLGIRIDANPPAVLVLVSVTDNRLRWISADRVVFITEDGWLTQTHGLPRDLAATRWIGNQDPLRGLVQTGVLPPRGVYREIDLQHDDGSSVRIESRFEMRGEEVITIQDRRYRCRRVDEIADARSWRWETRNSFWLDAQSGQVWRSIQQYCPEVPPMQLEVLKPLAQPANA